MGFFSNNSTPMNQQTRTIKLKQRNFSRKPVVPTPLKFNNFQRKLINTLSYALMRPRESLSFIIHQ